MSISIVDSRRIRVGPFARTSRSLQVCCRDEGVCYEGRRGRVRGLVRGVVEFRGVHGGHSLLVTLRIKVGRIRAESGCGSAEGPDIASVVTALAATPIAGTMARAPICSARGAQRDRAASSVGERSAAPAPLRIRLGHVPPRRAGAVSSGLQSDAGEGIEDACSAACGDATEGLRWRWPRLSTERGRLSTLLVDPSRKVGTCSSGLGPACKWRVTGPRWNVARSFVLPTRPLIPEGSSCLLPIPLLLCDPRYHGPGGHCYCPMPWMPLGVGVSTS